jgi:DNA-binding transcriptional regulator YiaG
MALDDPKEVQPFLSGDDPISRDDCRRRAFEYFIAAEETGDQEQRDALLEGGQKWLRLAAEIEHDTRRRETSLRNTKEVPVLNDAPWRPTQWGTCSLQGANKFAPERQIQNTNMGLIMWNIVSGRQLRSARVLAGLSQKEFAKAVGVHERAARYWENKEDQLPTCVPGSLEQMEAVLRQQGVVVFASPSPGARFATKGDWFASLRQSSAEGWGNISKRLENHFSAMLRTNFGNRYAWNRDLRRQ